MLVHGCSAVGAISGEREMAEKGEEIKKIDIVCGGERKTNRGRNAEESPKRKEGKRKSKRDKMVHAFVCVVD